jgi:hypothetical protein
MKLQGEKLVVSLATNTHRGISSKVWRSATNRTSDDSSKLLPMANVPMGAKSVITLAMALLRKCQTISYKGLTHFVPHLALKVVQKLHRIITQSYGLLAGCTSHSRKSSTAVRSD